MAPSFSEHLARTVFIETAREFERESGMSYKFAAYLRVASIAVGSYEFICTMPAAYRFYKLAYQRRTLSQQCTLFILIRYFSVLSIVLSNIGFFSTFSEEACARFFLVSPAFKAIQTIVSQVILATRTYSISRRSRWVFWTMIIALALSGPIEFFSNVYKRQPVQNPVTLNCTSGNKSIKIAWLNYAVAMVFDLITVFISTGYLWWYNTTATRISHFVQRLLYEGLGYFVVLTGCNILNLILYLRGSSSTQSTAASLGYVVIFIMSQSILIRQRDEAEKYAESQRLISHTSGYDRYETEKSMTVTRRLDNTNEINAALRSQFETSTTGSLSTISLFPQKPKPAGHNSSQTHSMTELQCFAPRRSRSAMSMLPLERTLESHAEVDEDSLETVQDREEDAGVSVRVEHTVSIEHTRRRMREDYRTPRTIWDSRGSIPRDS